MKYLLIAIAMIVALGCIPAVGQDLSKCSAIEKPLERLDCYDALAKPGAPSPYRSMSLDDFKLDRDTLKGAKVQLSGLLRQIGELAMLSKGLLGANLVDIEIKNLPREQRKAILECGTIGCEVVARGHVDKVFTGNGLVLESVTIIK
jgi:hypothetical protein